mmetsp:Transcript_34311/g.80244  ORF Transcript_34311/g.80244 Transcript_34311/m.80244 type:complete len:582 (+) Transcript_34311:104-1849(+)|eukprot:CAMPEP_0178371484 /NCGR_PEP_ID=MMETSP0689_2-20121128/850_1 /TAXON_ID=160604 /ORGANISM="Amphidinium massartii, Strain CS-259" /LENGTH=581 /DNA_ID=CAMNT_0019991355 /DNA_START=17 /DNA_END=1762 /DNA_ORIENTATION=-
MASKANILFLMADQLRWDAVLRPSFDGGPGKVFAPNLVELAHEGLAISHAYTSTPTCTPARSAILTGRSPWNHGMLGYGDIAVNYPVELATTMARGGYMTASVGKNHFGWNHTADAGVPHGFQHTLVYDGLDGFRHGSATNENDDYDKWFREEMPGADPTPTPRGYDRWNGWRARAYQYSEELHPTAWTGRAAVKFLRDYIHNGTVEKPPFLLKVSFHRPHSPYDPPQRLLDMVSEEDLPPMHLCRAAQEGKLVENVSPGDAWCLRFRGEHGDPAGCGPTSVDAWCGKMPDEEVKKTRRAYLASLRFVDEQIGLILGELRHGGLLENTWILFTSDHGDGQGDMYHWRKGYPYEFAAHVPMILRWPASWEAQQLTAGERVVPRGSVVQPPVVAELRDIFHTFVDAAGLSSNASLVPASSSHSAVAFEEQDGKSLLCLLRDPTGKEHCQYAPNPGPWRSWIDMEHSRIYNETMHWNALTDGRMKYIFRAFFADEQLFNLTEDPFETVDLSSNPAYSAELAQWRARLVSQFEREERGKQFVHKGSLMRRVNGFLYSPHYPKKAESTSVLHPGLQSYEEEDQIVV